MASTYTTSLKIQQIGNGEQAGTWGSTTNTNWNLIEQAVAGVQTITMANANYTLSNLNGTLDEARNAVIVVNGTNSGVYQVIAPLVEKFYTISNQTTGGYAVTIGGASGLTVSIPNSTTAQVYCDGSNFYSAMTASAGNYNVSGDLVVAGNETVSGNLTVTGTSNIVPAGSLMMWPTGSAPAGYLLCNGTAVSRSTYATLFSVVGTTFGAGDGSTTFNLPNYTNRVPYGTTVGATGGSADAIVVSHTHTATVTDPGHSHSASSSVTDPGHGHTYPVGGTAGGQNGYALFSYNLIGNGNTANANTGISVSTSINNASTGISVSNATVGSSGTNANLPPYLGINFIIKT